MKFEITVFMAIKSAFFFKAFSWDFHKKEIHSDLTIYTVLGERMRRKPQINDWNN